MAVITPQVASPAIRLSSKRVLRTHWSAQNAAIAPSQASAAAARQLPDPVLSVGIDSLPINKADRFNIGSDFMTMRRVGVMQELTRADKRRLRAGQFERAAGTSAAERARVDIERDSALAWLDANGGKRTDRDGGSISRRPLQPRRPPGRTSC